MALGQRVRQLRLAAGLTQQELAERAKVAISVITKLEGGQVKGAKWDTMVRIAQAMGVSLDQFLDDEERPSKLDQFAHSPHPCEKDHAVNLHGNAEKG